MSSLGLGGVYQLLLRDRTDNSGPLLSSPTALSDAPYFDTSKADFLYQLHRIAAENGKLLDFGHLIIRNSSENSEKSDIILTVGANAQVQGKQQQEEKSQYPEASRVKKSLNNLSGSFGAKFDRIQFDILVPSSPPSSMELPESNTLVTTPTSTSTPTPSLPLPPSPDELLSQICEYLKGDMNGKTLEEIQHHLHLSLQDAQNILLHGCNTQQLYRYPYINSKYEQIIYYLHPSYIHYYYCYEGHRPHHLLHKLSTFLPIYTLDSISLEEMELSCPWIYADGTRNNQLYTIFISKVLSILSMKPSCSITVIHSEFPTLTCGHMKILLMKLVMERYITHHIKRISSRLLSPFDNYSRSFHTTSSEENTNSSSLPQIHLDKSYFSIHPRLWEIPS